MSVDAEGRHVCGIAGTAYRGEEHSIWLRQAEEGYQVAPLDSPSVYAAYFTPTGERIPIFPLIAVLYSLALPIAYPPRPRVGIPEFAGDFHFTLDQVQQLFDCNPDLPPNATILGISQDRILSLPALPSLTAEPIPGTPIAPAPPGGLPTLPPAREINDGVGAELAVAADLDRCGWRVFYRGNQRSVGYDLEAQRETQTLRVEVKSSIGFTTPELTETEWVEAQRFGDEYILAIVDFYGSNAQSLWYVRNPALMTTPVEMAATIYRLPRVEIEPLKTDADFL
jgi:hypothetical protein